MATSDRHFGWGCVRARCRSCEAGACYGDALCCEVPGLVDLTVVSLAAQLHDVDDYKLVGKEQSERQANATEIMNSVGIDEVTQSKVRDIIANMGYSKSLKGIRPTTIEGKLVSDADMCDALGAGG